MPVSTRNRMSEKALRERLVGACTLTSYLFRDIKTGVEDRPFGSVRSGPYCIHPMATCRRAEDGNADVATRPTQLRRAVFRLLLTIPLIRFRWWRWSAAA
jgi:hypothetical protein